MKRTSLSSSFTYWPPPPRASFDDDRDLDVKANQKALDMEHWEMIDGCDESGQRVDEDENIETEARWMGFEVEQCPPSLKLLVRIFRFTLLSFSGIVFVTSPNSTSAPPKNFSHNRKISDSSSNYPPSRRQSIISQPPPIPRRSFRSRFISIFTLTLHTCITTSYLVPLIIGPFEIKRDSQNWLKLKRIEKSNSNSSSNSDFDFQEFFGNDAYWNEFIHLKPILRNITKSIVYIFMCDGLLQFALNLFLGGRLISRISQIPDITKHDLDQKLAIQLFLSTLTLTMGLSITGMIIFNQKQIKTLLDIIFGAGIDRVNRDDVTKLIKTCLVTSVHMYHYCVMAMIGVFFVYTMVVCRQIVEEMRREVVEVDLTETRLYCIKTRLTTLSLHFTGIIRYFALPLTTIMISNSLLIIGSSCFLMIHRLTDDDYFIIFIFNLGTFAFCRLVIICAWGNTVTNAHRELVREIYESIPEWTLTTWMDFLEIKRLGEKFEVNIGGVYSVKQSAILTVLGFALNYIVVLLQTENYSGRGAGQGNETNETEWGVAASGSVE